MPYDTAAEHPQYKQKVCICPDKGAYVVPGVCDRCGGYPIKTKRHSDAATAWIGCFLLILSAVVTVGACYGVIRLIERLLS